MSIDLMSAIWRTCYGQGGCLVLLLAMADHAKDDGTDIYPGLDLLAAKCRSSVRAVQDQIKRLRSDGVLKVVGPDGDDLPDDAAPAGGRGHKTEYRIDMERMQELHALHREQNPECEHCQARSKRAGRATRKGEASRTLSTEKRVQIDGGKGEARRTKGEDSRDAYRIEPSESSLNLPPPDDAAAPEGRAVGTETAVSEVPSKSSPLARTRKLAGMFEPAVLEAWFKNSRFDEGPPLTLVLDARYQCNWVRERFGQRLRDTFGENLAFGFQRERARSDADA